MADIDQVAAGRFRHAERRQRGPSREQFAPGILTRSAAGPAWFRLERPDLKPELLHLPLLVGQLEVQLGDRGRSGLAGLRVAIAALAANNERRNSTFAVPRCARSPAAVCGTCSASPGAARPMGCPKLRSEGGE